MSHIESFKRASDHLSERLVSDIQNFQLRYINSFDYTKHQTGLVFGHVQSGKTQFVLGLIAAAADREFRYFILLTPDNIRIQRQTLERAQRVFKSIVVCGENDDVQFRRSEYLKPTVLVLKKNRRVLESWSRRMSAVGVSRHPIIIFDDEGDVASLNTRANRDSVSIINHLISSIRFQSNCSLYVAITATPYANLLQSADSHVRPGFVFCLEPGDGYLGGEFFYFDDARRCLLGEDEAEILLDSSLIPIGLRRALTYFILTCIDHCYILNEDTCNFLIHPSVRIEHHALVAGKVACLLKSFKRDLGDNSSFLGYWLQDCYSQFGDFCEPIEFYLNRIGSLINKINVSTVNSESPIDDDYTGFNVLVGGSSLGRGVTFPKLQVTYYCRDTSTPQMDTVWQHSRLFGYDRNPGKCKLFINPRLYQTFREITDSTNALFDSLKSSGPENILVLSPAGIRPTRPNVIRRETILTFVGGVNYFTDSVSDDFTKELDLLLGLNDGVKTMNSSQVIEILGYCSGGSNPQIDLYCECLRTLTANGYGQCQVYIRTDRDISKGTGTLLSPDDRLLSMEDHNKVVLLMYRLFGEARKGWQDKPLWIPNIKFPIGICFYTEGLT